MDYIPDDSLALVLSIVSWADRASVRATSKRFVEVVASEIFAGLRRGVDETAIVVVQREVGGPTWILVGDRLLKGPPLPVTATICGSHCALVGAEVFVVVSSDVREDRSHLFALDVARGAWRELAAPPGPISGPSLEAVNGRLILAGGELLPPDHQSDEHMESIHLGSRDLVAAGVHEYDFQANEWRPLSQMSMPVRDAASAVLGNQMVIIGGVDFSHEGYARRGLQCHELQFYDTDTNRWSEPVIMHCDHPPAPTCANAIALNGNGYIEYTGGILNGQVQDRVEIITPEHNCIIMPEDEILEKFEYHPPSFFQCPVGCVKHTNAKGTRERLVVLDRKNTFQKFTCDHTCDPPAWWTPIRQIPRTTPLRDEYDFDFPSMCSRVPLV